MSKSRKQEESNSSTVTIRSSYFNTEVTASGVSDESTNVDLSGRNTVDVASGTSKESKRNGPKCIYQKKTVSISVQADRSIVGQEDSLPKERKRWVRPPVVGQASSNDEQSGVVSQGQLSSESESEIQAQISSRNESAGFMSISDVYQHRKDYIGERSMEGGSDQSLPPFTELQDFQRVPTPSSVSSITPRPLEWDSGADVGYFQQYGEAPNIDQQLSTIERLTLDQGQGRTGIPVRSDPEGTTSSKKVNSTVINMIGNPNSESTPISFSDVKRKSASNISSKSSKSSYSQRQYHLFPEVIIQNKGDLSDSSSDCNYSFKIPETGKSSSNTTNKKLSTSLENLSDGKLFENQAATFPRSQSQLNLTDDCNSRSLTQQVKAPQSVSSSSLATVVTGSTQKASKLVQTSNIKNHVGTQSSIVEERDKYRRAEQNDSSTLESAQMSGGDRVNSFEYLPGHVYENAQNSEKLDSWVSGEGISLRNDVERGVQILEEFIQGSNANNTLMKKELIQRVVKCLINTDYPEDSHLENAMPERCSTRRSQNRDEVIGESSSENGQTFSNKPATDNSTTVSGESSSPWPSVSDSTKSSDPSHSRLFPSKLVQKKLADEKKCKSNIGGTSDSKSDWKAPVTQAEKLYEHRKKGSRKEVNSDDQLLDFINSERENQLDWIVKEINHLSNLKTLLEKHERLRKNLNRLKKAKQKNERVLENEIRPTAHTRLHPFRRKPLSNPELFKKPTFIKPPHKFSKEPESVNEESGWDSHNYEADERGRLKKTVSTETRKEDILGGTRSTAYTITFDPSYKIKKTPEKIENTVIADRQTLAKKSREYVRDTYQLSSLQEYLVTKRPDIVSRAEMRRKTIAELAAVRQLREEQRPKVLAAALSTDTAHLEPLPPPLVKRVVSQKEMRQQTEKKYRQTFEVKKKISDQKLKETLKTNRLMADIYNKRLQRLTLKGHTDLSNSLDVISTV